MEGPSTAYGNGAASVPYLSQGQSSPQYNAQPSGGNRQPLPPAGSRLMQYMQPVAAANNLNHATNAANAMQGYGNYPQQHATNVSNGPWPSTSTGGVPLMMPGVDVSPTHQKQFVARGMAGGGPSVVAAGMSGMGLNVNNGLPMSVRPHQPTQLSPVRLGSHSNNHQSHGYPQPPPLQQQPQLHAPSVSRQELYSSPLMNQPPSTSGNGSGFGTGIQSTPNQRQTSTPDQHQTYIQGGTTYFYPNMPGGDATTPTAAVDTLVSQPEMETEQQAELPVQANQPSVVTPGFFAYTGPLPYMGRFRAKGTFGFSSYFAPHELKAELLHRQLAAHSQVDPSVYPDLPLELDIYRQLTPLEAVKPAVIDPQQRTFFGAYHSTVYKAINSKDGMPYCLRRLHDSRLTNQKSLQLVDLWKKLIHAHVVQLKDVFPTRTFGDYSLIFIYDYYPLAETLQARHFTDGSSSRVVNGVNQPTSEGRRSPTGSAGPSKFKIPSGPTGGLPESLIWTYVIQLSSAIRAIHAAGMAVRTIDPTKIIVCGKSKLMLGCCGILDVLTFEANHPNTVQGFQQEDLMAFGRLIASMCCGSLQAVYRDPVHLQNTLQFITQHYSSDMKNLVGHLLAPHQPGRLRNINDIMPMIGARFYAQLEAAQMRNDLLENELSKEVENGRLLRLLCKLGTINERPEFNLDPSWSETGDRYLLKLYRDYLFHQVTEDGRPWMDMAHVVQSLNKLDAGVSEKIQLMSRDGENVLVVSYFDLRQCLESAFQELQGAPPVLHRS